MMSLTPPLAFRYSLIASLPHVYITSGWPCGTREDEWWPLRCWIIILGPVRRQTHKPSEGNMTNMFFAAWWQRACLAVIWVMSLLIAAAAALRAFFIHHCTLLSTGWRMDLHVCVYVCVEATLARTCPCVVLESMHVRVCDSSLGSENNSSRGALDTHTRCICAEVMLSWRSIQNQRQSAGWEEPAG